MKKLLFFLFSTCFVFLANAQNVEYYPTSQRYLFNEYNRDSLALDSVTAIISIYPNPFVDDLNNPYTGYHEASFNTILIQKYYRTRFDSVSVYGVALPIYLHEWRPDVGRIVHDMNWRENDSIWNALTNQYLDSITNGNKYIYLFKKNDSIDNLLDVVDSVQNQRGVNIVTGNSFEFPNLGNWTIPGLFNFPVVEVYFKEPHIVYDSFWIGTSLIRKVWFGGFVPEYTPDFSLFAILDPSANDYFETCGFYQKYRFPGIAGEVDSVLYDYYNGNNNFSSHLWGGPFAILTPPPCMKPHNLQVHQQQHYDSVLLTWEMPSGVSFCRLEYGPAGFTPGSGTVVNGITDEHYMIGGLAASTEYDFRVSGWCIYDSAFSATTDTAYTTPEACTSKFQTNITGVTDSSFTVKWRLPDGSAYGELLYGVQGFGDDDGTLVSPVLPDTTGWCSVHLTGLQPGTSYELHIRNWCPYGDVFSPYDIRVARTIAHYTVTAVPNNPAWGSVSGSGEYLEGTQATLVATPTAGGPFHFAVWSDGVTSRVRAISVTQDISLTALFVCDTCTEGIGDFLSSNYGDDGIQVHPNPASDQVTVTAQTVISRIEIYAVSGNQLITENPNSYSFSVDISRLAIGNYMLRVYTTDHVVNKRLIVK